jgi:hypothetical protein
MATRIAWLLNFDAAEELGNPARYTPARLPAERLRELLALFFDLVDAADLVLDHHAPSAATGAHHPDLTVQAFCPTPSALGRIAALGFDPPPAPSLGVLQRVSDRGFCAGLGHGLAAAAFVRDMPTLRAQLQRASFTGTHVIKRAFSFAGREQRRVHGGVLDDSTRGFCERSFELGQGVQVEPWVQRLGDFSQHGYLTRSGELLVAAPREQRCDAMGRFLGMQAGPARLGVEEAHELRSALDATATALSGAGYFGPFGIDAFRYQAESGAPALNPRCEINARFTMGYPRELLLRGLGAEPRRQPG